ncbi:MAG: hypothetical protein ACP5Q4_10900, partial [Candidatus Caldatribacteriaceae bacterium]
IFFQSGLIKMGFFKEEMDGERKTVARPGYLLAGGVPYYLYGMKDGKPLRLNFPQALFCNGNEATIASSGLQKSRILWLP